MTLKVRNQKDMTKNELIESITHKAQKAVPMTRNLLLSGLKYKNKKELKRIDSKMRVSRNGNEISIS